MAIDVHERLFRELAHWRKKFLDGQLKQRGIGQPKLGEGEHFGGLYPLVGYTSGEITVPVRLWQPGVGSRGYTARDTHGLVLTNRRIILRGNWKTLREWRLADIHLLKCLPAQIYTQGPPAVWGVSIRNQPEDSTIDVLARRPAQVGIDHTCTPLPLWLQWLKVECAYAASRGDDVLNRWWDCLPERIFEANDPDNPYYSPYT